jgi:hypothetical protein
MRRLFAAFVLATIATGVFAQEGVTVESLLKDGYEIKASFPTNIGPGIVLQKGEQAVMCFVSETPKSPDIATSYCKPIH